MPKHMPADVTTTESDARPDLFAQPRFINGAGFVVGIYGSRTFYRGAPERELLHLAAVQSQTTIQEPGESLVLAVEPEGISAVRPQNRLNISFDPRYDYDGMVGGVMRPRFSLDGVQFEGAYGGLSVFYVELGGIDYVPADFFSLYYTPDELVAADGGGELPRLRLSSLQLFGYGSFRGYELGAS